MREEPAALDKLPLAGRRVLVIEDEVRLARLLGVALTRAGSRVDLAHDGGEGLAKAATGGHDVVVLDLMLPTMSGVQVVRELRSTGHAVPILMLTARDDEHDELAALRLGTDDYVTKPFSTPVLIARLSNLVQRRPAEPLLRLGRLRLHPDQHRVHVGDAEVPLTAREFAVLSHLVGCTDRAVSKQELLEDVWDEPYGDPNLVEVCVAGLRRKVGDQMIETIRGVGYRARAET